MDKGFKQNTLPRQGRTPSQHQDPPDDMQVRMAERNRQLGAMLKRARVRQGRSVTTCCAHIATTRRRYSDIEKGQARCSAVELTELCGFLGIPQEEVLAYIMGASISLNVRPTPMNSINARWAAEATLTSLADIAETLAKNLRWQLVQVHDLTEEMAEPDSMA